MTNGEARRIAVITGGSRGIGHAIATRLVDEGWKVLSVSRSPNTDQAPHFLVERLFHDLSTEAGINAAVSDILSRTDKLDLLVNNAGSIGDHGSLASGDFSEFSSSVQLMAIAPLMLARILRPALDRGVGAAIINVGSVYGEIADPDVAAYCLAKSAIPLLTKMMARSFAPIRVNCILPGHIDTEMTRGAPDEFISGVRDRTPLCRIGNASEVADLVYFLSSSEASFISGASVSIDGGFMSAR